GLDRITNFHFSNRNELGDEVELVLSVEVMGRHSNVILYNQKDNHIIDLLKRINPDENRARILLPKAKYELPPLKPGLNGLTLSEDKFKQLSNENDPNELSKQMDGLDKDDRNELLGYLEDDYSYSSFKTFFNQFENPRAFVLKTPNNKRKIFCYLPYHLELEKESSNPDLNKGL
ncbi:NFACT family protein, partial [Lactobacillus helveticus]